MGFDIARMLGRASAISKIVFFLIIFYVTGFTYLTARMYASFYYYGFDLAVFNQVMWTTLHDGFFYSSVVTGGNYFGQQMTPILILFLPLYALFQNPQTLLFLQSLLLGFGALPLYLIARHILNERWGLLFVILYLVHPTIAFMNFHEFHTNSFEPFLLLFSFYSLLRKRTTPFMIFAFLSLLCKEDVAPIVMAFGLYAIVLRYEKRHIITPLVMGGLYMVVVFYLIMPLLGGTQYIYFKSEQYGRYGHLGSTPGEILRNAALHPDSLVQFMVSGNRVNYLLQMAAFSGFLPLFSPDVLIIASAALLENLLSNYPPQTFIYFHYNSLVTPFLIVASIFSTRKLLSLFPARVTWRVIISSFIFFCLSMSLVFCILFNPLLSLAPHQELYAMSEKDRTKLHIASMITPHSSVIATASFLPLLSNRKDAYSFYYLERGKLNLSGVTLQKADPEYMFIDLGDNLTRAERAYILSFLEDAKWGILAFSGDIILLRKGYPSPYTTEDIYKSLLVESGGQAICDAATWVRQNIDAGERFLALTAYETDAGITYMPTWRENPTLQFVQRIADKSFENTIETSPVFSSLPFFDRYSSISTRLLGEELGRMGISYIFVFYDQGGIVSGIDDNSFLDSGYFELVFRNESVEIYRIVNPKGY